MGSAITQNMPLYEIAEFKKDMHIVKRLQGPNTKNSTFENAAKILQII